MVLLADRWKMFVWACVVLMAMCLACSDSSNGGQAAKTTASSPAGSSGSTPTQPASPLATSGPGQEDTRTDAELASAGRSVYMANCIACHNIDATKDGALGPAVGGSSLELLEARIVQGNYPPGYEPKRDTRVMVALPHLEPNLKELAVYLDSLN